MYVCISLVNHTLIFRVALSIGDLKCPLTKGIVNCLYLFVQRIDRLRISQLLIGVELVYRDDDHSTILSYHMPSHIVCVFTRIFG